MRWILLAMLTCACTINPDGQSGADERRDIATELPLGEWVTDKDGVSYGAGDRTDWKKIMVPRDGTLFVEVACQKRETTLVVGMYDRYGRMLGEKVKKHGETDHIKFEGDVQKGKYFLRVAAKDTEDACTYDIKVAMQGGSGIGNIEPPE